MQTTGRKKRVPAVAQPREQERPTALRQRLNATAYACDTVLHGLGRFVFILAPFAMIAVLIFGLGYVRLRHGPVSLKFLVAPIERGINAELEGNSVKIDDAVVSLSETGGVEFRLRNLRMSESDGDVVASAPLAAVELSPSALWSARIVPARVELIEPKLYVFYSDDSGLSLSFPKPVESSDAGAAPLEPPKPVPATPPPTGQQSSPGSSPSPKSVKAPTAAPESVPGPLKRIDLARMVTDMSARARQSIGASSFLKEVGLRNATVVFEYAGKSTEWRVPSLVVGLMHGRARSVISGRATVESGGQPWKLTFETDESERNHTLTLKTSIRELHPRSLAPAVPQLSLLQAFDMPVEGDATLELSTAGDIRAATLSLEIGHGSLRLPALPEAPLEVDGGTIKVAYDGAAQRVLLSPSTLRWRGSRITMSGAMQSQGQKDGHPVWSYDLSANEGEFAAAEFAVAPVKLQSWRATGRVLPHRGEIEVADFNLKAGGAEIAMKGDFVAGADPASTRLEGSLSPMPLDTLKALWPKAIGPGAREWVGERVAHANFLGGTFRFVSGAGMEPGEAGAEPAEHRLSLAVQASDVEMRIIDNMPPVVAPRLLTRIENDALEMTIPDATVAIDPEHQLPLKAGRFTVTNVLNAAPSMGEVVFASETSLGLVLGLIEKSPLGLLEEAGLARQNIDGKFDGQFKVSLPLTPGTPTSAIKVEGKAHITDGKAKDILGPYDVQGASIGLDITEKAVDANGELLINGVLAKVGWQRIFDAPIDKQPPLRLTATLDNTDRTQLGLDVNHIVQGEVPVEITITRGARNEPAIRLRADLSNADLLLENVSWHKSPGRPAMLQCDIAQGRTHKIELQNFKVAGDDIAIEGWAAIGADNRLREFYFPDFSLNVVTRMEVQGSLGSDNIWKVKAHGSTFDGRDFFRSLFSLGQLAEQHPAAKKPRDGIDLDAEISNVIGFSEVNLRGVKLKLSKRGEKLTALDVRGTLDGGKPLAVALRQDPGHPRQLLADSTDAGQAFKLIDFYPNIQGGRVRLEVNLDGSGPAEKTGVLYVEDFRILGDPVVSEVFSTVDEEQVAGKNGATKRPKVVREVFEFNRMRVPFSVGYGQFVMEESYLRGPLLGASIRGKIDFKMRRVNLGGTYVPLQGLMGDLCEIPIFGPIALGPKCEGLSGMTYAIQGPMDHPQVIVNPLAMLAPGIFREIFQMTNPNPKVQRRDDTPNPTSGENTRASSTTMGAPKDAPQGSEDEASSQANSDTVDGWSSQTTPNPQKKKKQ
ncbi:MAG: AsmA-like C-terminal region-containing protein [Hyphomicrobium sp.]